MSGLPVCHEHPEPVAMVEVTYDELTKMREVLNPRFYTPGHANLDQASPIYWLCSYCDAYALGRDLEPGFRFRCHDGKPMTLHGPCAHEPTRSQGHVAAALATLGALPLETWNSFFIAHGLHDGAPLIAETEAYERIKTKLRIDQVRQAPKGLYLYRKGDTVLYVGTAENLHHRIHCHYRESVFSSGSPVAVKVCMATKSKVLIRRFSATGTPASSRCCGRNSNRKTNANSSSTCCTTLWSRFLSSSEGNSTRFGKRLVMHWPTRDSQPIHNRHELQTIAG